MVVGTPEVLLVTINSSDATDRSYSVVSSDSTVATVSSTDMVVTVTTIAAGSTSITVTTTDGAKTATCQVSVSATATAVTGVSLDKSSITINRGARQMLTATVAPADATNQDVTWSSSDETIAIVSNSGLVTGLTKGTAVIVATTVDGGFTATCTITVRKESIDVDNLSADDVNLFTSDLTLYTVGAQNHTAIVYSATGQQISQINDLQPTHSISLPQSGLYIVIIDNIITKILIH